MSNKNEKNFINIEQITEAAQNIGVVLMTAAVTLGIATDHMATGRVVLPNQPALATAGEQGGNPLRREREESAPHYISYNVTQRTPARSGKQ